MITYKEIDNIDDCLKYCVEYNKNKRFNIVQLEKYLSCLLSGRIHYYGLYDNDVLKCVAVWSLETINKKDGVYLDSIEVLECGKKYGKQMIDHLCDLKEYFYLLSNPDDGEELKNYYRKTYPFFNEIKIKNSVFDKKDISFFYKTYNKVIEEKLVKKLKQDYTLS